jgi:soluble lytic murein transglycosylase-like protein
MPTDQSRFRVRARSPRLGLLAALLALSLAPAAALADTGSTQAAGSQSSQDHFRTLRVGSTGAPVREIQRKLHLRVTGYYGDETAAAVKRFQRRHHLKATGEVDRATAHAMRVQLRGAVYASGGAAPPSDSGHSTVTLPAELKKIAKCESGGNPRAISPSGRYRGKYQFDMETWRSVGGHGDPAKASEEEQDRRALKLYKREGKKPWPNCA